MCDEILFKVGGETHLVDRFDQMLEFCRYDDVVFDPAYSALAGADAEEANHGCLCQLDIAETLKNAGWDVEEYNGIRWKVREE